jgi:multisubunit Na+/H+ antiporter MnhB subunit
MNDLLIAYVVVGLICLFIGLLIGSDGDETFREFLLNRACVIWASIFWLPLIVLLAGFMAYLEWSPYFLKFYKELKNKIEHDKNKNSLEVAS